MLATLLRVRELLHDKIATASTPELISELANVDELDASQQDDAEYAAMARAFLSASL